MSRPAALICPAISATGRAPCSPKTWAMAAPMVWRTDDGRFAFGLRFGFSRGAAFVLGAGAFESQELTLGDAKIAELRLHFGDFRADALDRCVHDPFAYRESYSLVLRLSYSRPGAVICSGRRCRNHRAYIGAVLNTLPTIGVK